MKIKVNGSEFLFFNDITIAMVLDSVASAFSFSARFNPNNDQHKELFRPLAYPTVEIYHNDGRLLLTGTVLNQNQKSTAEPNLTTLSGYSLPGVLEDSNIPLSAFPLESLKRSLKDIASKLLGIFSLKLIIAPNVLNDANGIYEKTSAEPTDSIASYLAKLAAQRNIVLSHDEKGNVLLFRPDANAVPKYFFDDQNGVDMSWAVNGQQLHSEINVIRQPSEDNPGVSLADKANNPLIGAYRPSVSVLSSGKETDTKRAADNKMASELSGLVLNLVFEKYVEVSPGDIVEVQNPEVYLYNKTRFMVSGVNLKETETGITTELNVVLPESYTGAIPKNIFQ